MQGFIKNQAIILGFLLLGFFSGLILYVNSSNTVMNRVVYECLRSDVNSLPDYFSSDTLVEQNNMLFRHYTSSFADTLQNDLKRGEVKFYLEHCSNKNEARELLSNIGAGNKAHLVQVKCENYAKSSLPILSYSLIGLFVGLLVHSLNRISRPNLES